MNESNVKGPTGPVLENKSNLIYKTFVCKTACSMQDWYIFMVNRQTVLYSTGKKCSSVMHHTELKKML